MQFELLGLLVCACLLGYFFWLGYSRFLQNKRNVLQLHHGHSQLNHERGGLGEYYDRDQHGVSLPRSRFTGVTTRSQKQVLLGRDRSREQQSE